MFPSTPRYRAALWSMLLLATAGRPAVGLAQDRPVGSSASVSPPSPAEPNRDGPAAPLPAPVPPGPPAPAVAHPDRAVLQAIAVAGRRLAAVGAGGLVILSDDDGASWRQAPVPVSSTLTGIGFADDHAGWAIGHDGVVLRTTDGGEHWTLAQDGVRAARAMLSSAENGNDADSVRAGRVRAAEALVKDPSRPFVLMQLAGADTLRVIGTGELSTETTDGGGTWRPWTEALDDPARTPLYGLAQRDGVLLLAGADGLVLAGRPEDGLHPVRSPGDATLFGVLATDGSILAYGQQGHVYRTATSPADLAGGKAPDWHGVPGATQTAFTAGLVLRDGGVLLGDASGTVWRLSGKASDPRLVATRATTSFPILGMAEAADGSVIAVGSGGAARLTASTLSGGSTGA